MAAAVLDDDPSLLPGLVLKCEQPSPESGKVLGAAQPMWLVLGQILRQSYIAEKTICSTLGQDVFRTGLNEPNTAIACSSGITRLIISPTRLPSTPSYWRRELLLSPTAT